MKRFSMALALCAAVGATGNALAENLVALVGLPASNAQSIYSFDSSLPALGTTLPVTGLGANERLLGIDFRPLTGQLYGLSSGSAIYTIDTSTGAASIVGSGFTTTLVDADYGFDFNPVIDKIRIVSDGDANLVAHPDTGDANIASPIFPVSYGASDLNVGADPNVVHHAYDGNVLGQLASATQLRAIDTELDILVTQANNAGTLGTVGSLGIDATEIGGFDVATTGNAFAAFADGAGGSTSTLYSINLMTGEALSLGLIPLRVEGLAAVPVPEPSSVLLIAAAATCCGMLRRRR